MNSNEIWQEMGSGGIPLFARLSRNFQQPSLRRTRTQSFFVIALIFSSKLASQTDEYSVAVCTKRRGCGGRLVVGRFYLDLAWLWPNE